MLSSSGMAPRVADGLEAVPDAVNVLGTAPVVGA